MPKGQKAAGPLAPNVTKVTKSKPKPKARKLADEKVYKSTARVADSDLDDDSVETKPTIAPEITVSKPSKALRSKQDSKNEANEKLKPVRVPATNILRQVSQPDTSEDERSSEDVSDVEISEAPAEKGTQNRVSEATSGHAVDSSSDSEDEDSSESEGDAEEQPTRIGMVLNNETRPVRIQPSAPTTDVDSSSSSSEADSDSSDESKSDIESEEDIGPSNLTKPAPVNITNSIVPTANSTIEVESSDDDSESESDSEAEPVKPTTHDIPNNHGNTPASINASSEDEESTDSESESSEDLNELSNKDKSGSGSSPESKTEKRRLAAKAQSSKLEEDIADGYDSSSDESIMRPRAPTPDDIRTVQEPQIQTADIRPPLQFKPPTGYLATPAQDIRFDPLNDSFKPSRRKQLFYISAPASVPIEKLKKIPLEKKSNGEIVMTHESRNYTLRPDIEAQPNTRLFLPGKRGYNVLRTQVHHVLQLQQVVDLTVASTATNGVSRSAASVQQDIASMALPKRRQPPGLKAKLRPSGYGDDELGDIGSSGDEEGLSASQKISDRPIAIEPLASTHGATESQHPALSLAQADNIKKRKEAGVHSENGQRKSKKSKEATTGVAALDHNKNVQFVQEATKTISADQATAPPEATRKEKKKKDSRKRGEQAG